MTTPDRRRTECRPAAPERTQQASGHQMPEYDAAQGHTETRNVLTIELPVQIARELTPNASRAIHWGTKTRLLNELKETTWKATLAAVQNHHGPVPAIPLVMHLTVYHGRNRKRHDDDNIIGWAKRGVRDTIAQTLHVDDRHITTGTITQLRDPSGLGFVVVRLEHVA